MSVTTKLWSKKELEEIEKNEWHITLLMNTASMLSEELKAYHKISMRKRTFILYWYNGEDLEIRVSAPSLKMLKRYILEEYVTMPNSILEETTKHKAIYLK